MWISINSLLHHAMARLVVSLVLVFLFHCSDKSPDDWIAILESIHGNVSIKAGPSASLVAGKRGHHLCSGHSLETGPGSTAFLRLRNGGALTIRENSVVLFQSHLPQQQLKVVLEEGSLVGKGSTVEGSELIISLDQRTIRLISSAEALIESTGRAQPKITVRLGQATVEEPAGAARTVVAGSELLLVTTIKPDAAVPQRPDLMVPLVVGEEIVFFLQSVGHGRVLIKRPKDNRYRLVKRGELIQITPGTILKLLPRARVLVGPEKGSGTTVNGPSQVIVREGPSERADGKPAVRLESVSGNLQVMDRGNPGKKGSNFMVEGVNVATKIVYRRLDVRVQKERGRHLVKVLAGEASLTSKDKKIRLEAGQEASIKRGQIIGPQNPPPAPLQLQQGGTIRVFVPEQSIPVTLRWKTPEGSPALVEVARDRAMLQPLFSDVIQRNILTVPAVRRGALFWQVSPLDSQGQPKNSIQGRLSLLRDTSHLMLKTRTIHQNTIHQEDGDTEVYYQNKLPRFTFRWSPMPDALRYQFKIFREQNLARPLLTVDRRTASLTLPTGKIGEGSYIWYVVGRRDDGELVKAIKGRKLTVRYDNATPDLQIIYPRNGLTVAQESISIKGVTMPGSTVTINGTKVELDKTSRFAHTVPLKPGLNHIIFLVSDPRRGTSYYLRAVHRK